MHKDKTILLIDDDQDSVALIKETLEEEFAVVTAFNGQEGIRKFAMQEFDLVISDFHMPKMSGGKFILHLRELEKKLHLSPTLVLIITGDKIMAERALKCFDKTFIIEKPFDHLLLLKLAKKIVAELDKKKAD